MNPVVADLGNLIAFPTVSNRPILELAAYIATRHEALGHRVEQFHCPTMDGKANVVSSVGPNGVPGLVLSGHMDVVPTEGQPWTSDPFKLTERDGKLYGRGTADMKGFIAATLQALARIDPREFTKELVCIWTHDEEVGCLGSAWLAEALLDQDRPLPTDCLIGEPTSFEVLRMHPGHVAATFHFGGQAAHSSRPDLGVNAIEAASRAVVAIADLARDLEQEARDDLPELERPWVAVNNAMIKGGSAVNIVPDKAELQVGYRPLPGMPADEVYRRMTERIEALGLPGGFHGHLDRITPAMLSPDTTPLAHSLLEHSHHDHCGAASFATDGGNLARLGMKPLIFGPGQITVAHKADEHLDAAELIAAVEIVEAIIRTHCC